MVRLNTLLEESPKGYHTTTILCRTMDEAKALYQQLDQDDIALLEDSSESQPLRVNGDLLKDGVRRSFLIWNVQMKRTI